MYNPCDVATRIQQTAEENDVSIRDMLSNCGLPENTIVRMSNGKATPFDGIAKIADYLSCSVDYLLGRTDSPNTKHEDELNLLYVYRKLSANDKQDVFDYAFGRLNVFDCMLGDLVG